MHIRFLAILAVTLLASACARHVDTSVTRFHQGHIPLGASFVVMPGESVHAGPEFDRYARLVGDEMAGLGYREAADGEAELEVAIDYSVSEGRTKITSRPDHVYPAYSYHLGVYHYPFYHGFYYPYYYDGYLGPDIRSQTVYTRTLSMRIADRTAERVLFEGRAVSEGPTGEISAVMPYLVESMFRNFPGESGATKVVEIETRDGKRY